MIHRPPVLAPPRCACFGNVAKPSRRIFGWHRHITLSMFALASLTVIRKVAVGGEEPMDLTADLLPLTVPEVRRLLAPLFHGPGALAAVAALKTRASALPHRLA